MGGIVKGIGGAISGSTDYLFGNNIPGELKKPRITSFDSPGLSAIYSSPTRLGLTRSPEMDLALSGVTRGFGEAAGEYSALKPLVRPGFGRLTESAIRAVRDARDSTIGDLKTNLARRRVRGSSFGADDISRTASEFAKREDELTSKAFIQEMAMTQDLIAQETEADVKQFLNVIQQSNIESSMAATMASGVTNVLSNNAQMMGQMSNRGSDALWGLAGIGMGGGFNRYFSGGGNPSGVGGPSTMQPGPNSFWNT